MHAAKSTSIALPPQVVLVLASLLASFPAQAQSSQSVKPFFTFTCDSTGKTCPNGTNPTALIQSADGDFYGATVYGGMGNQAAGTVFRLTPSGQLTTIFALGADQSGNYQRRFRV